MYVCINTRTDRHRQTGTVRGGKGGREGGGRERERERKRERERERESELGV